MSRKSRKENPLRAAVLGALKRLDFPPPGELADGMLVQVTPWDANDPEYIGVRVLTITEDGAGLEVFLFSKGLRGREEIDSHLYLFCEQKKDDRADRRLLHAIGGLILVDSEVVSQRGPLEEYGALEAHLGQREIPLLTEKLLQDALVEPATGPWLRKWAFLHMGDIEASQAVEE